MLLDNRGKPAGKAFIRLGLFLQHVAGKDHMILMRLKHVGHFLIGRSADGGHGGLRLLIRLHPDLVDAVGHVLLLRSFQRFGQGVIQHHALLRVCLKLVDQHHLRRRLVLQ
jgi:hypothetical protein